MSRDADCNITLFINLIILIILGKWGQQYQHNVRIVYIINSSCIVIMYYYKLLRPLKKHYATAGGSFLTTILMMKIKINTKVCQKNYFSLRRPKTAQTTLVVLMVKE